MKQIIVCLLLCGIITAGCDWDGIETGAGNVATYSEKGAGIAPTLTPVAGPYAGMAGLVLSGVANIALAVKAFAANKKKQQIAKAAVIAADARPGGGSDLNNAAALLNVGEDVRRAYEDNKEG